MEQEKAILVLAALAQPTRLDVFRLLVQHEPDGMLAGDIARTLAVPNNTLSSHLNVLSHAGLVTSVRKSRTVNYRADLNQFRLMTNFLLKDCCGGRPEVCAELIEDLKPCCPTTPQKKDCTNV